MLHAKKVLKIRTIKRKLTYLSFFNKFLFRKSTSFKERNETFLIFHNKFWNGNGTVGEETVNVDGKIIDNVAFGLATYINTSASDNGGVFGLQYSTMKGDRFDNGISKLFSKGDNQIVSIFQNKTSENGYEGLLTFGEKDLSHCKDTSLTFNLGFGFDYSFDIAQMIIWPFKIDYAFVYADPTRDVSYFPLLHRQLIFRATNATYKNEKNYVSCEQNDAVIALIDKKGTILRLPIELFIEKVKICSQFFKNINDKNVILLVF